MEKEYHQIEKELRFKSIYLATFDKLSSLFLRSFKDKELVHDALQEGYLKLWEKLEAQKEGEDCMAFLYFYTRNYVLKQIARDLKRELLQEDLFQGMNQVSMDAELEHKEYQMQLSKVVHELPQKRREVFRLFNEEGLSYKSIGNRLGISSKTVDSHLAKATQTIKRDLLSIYGIAKIFFVLLIC